MKILFVTPTEIDQSSGAALRSRHLLNALSLVGDTYVVQISRGETVSFQEDWDDRKYRLATRTTDGFSLRALRERRTLRSHIGALLAAERFDHIVVRYPSTVLLLPPTTWPMLIVDADDAFKFPPSGASLSLVKRIRLRARNRFVRFLCGRAAHAWLVHPLDVPRLRSTRKSLLENSIDFPDAVSIDLEGPPRILMVGAFFYAPNADGLRWFVREVLPALRAVLPNIELRVVGRHTPSLVEGLAQPAIRLLGFVDDIAPEYDRASLVIAPIFVGSGTQIKVIDALAHGRPLVATELAYAGFADHLLRGVHLLVENEVDRWIQACLRVLRNRDEAEEMARRGREAARVFGTDRFAGHVRDTLASLSPAGHQPDRVKR